MRIQEAKKRDPLTEAIIGAAIEVHRNLGPGLSEKLYEKALCLELTEWGLRYERQKMVEVKYKGRRIGIHRIDLLVEDAVVLELKSVSAILPVHRAQVLNYLQISDCKIGLIINFDVTVLKTGIRRLAL